MTDNENSFTDLKDFDEVSRDIGGFGSFPYDVLNYCRESMEKQNMKKQKSADAGNPPTAS